VAVWLSW